MAEIRQTMVYGVWFYESGGIRYKESEGVPNRDWKLLHIIPGKYRSLDEIKSKIEAVIELYPECDTILLGKGTEFTIYDTEEALQTFKHLGD